MKTKIDTNSSIFNFLTNVCGSSNDSMQLTNVIESLDEPLRCVLTRPLIFLLDKLEMFRSSHPEVFLGKGVLIICGKFTGEHPCWSAIWIKLQITFRHGCSPVNLLHIFRTPFVKNTSRRLLLNVSDFNYFQNKTTVFPLKLLIFFSTELPSRVISKLTFCNVCKIHYKRILKQFGGLAIIKKIVLNCFDLSDVPPVKLANIVVKLLKFVDIFLIVWNVNSGYNFNVYCDLTQELYDLILCR